MSVSTVTEIYSNPRLKALKDKHSALSKKVEEAQKSMLDNDFYIKQLKKQKLSVKEQLAMEEIQASSSSA